MKQLIFSLTMALQPLLAAAADIYAPVLEQIERNNPTLQALQAQMEAQREANHTGLTPADPEVEFGWLWGSPAAIGTRRDISVRQTFDFPTAYSQRGALAATLDHSAEWQYKSQRMELLLEAKRICAQVVHCRELLALYERQLEVARRIASSQESLLRAGAATDFDYNKAALNRAKVESEARDAQLRHERLLDELATLNGGQRVDFSATDYGDDCLLPADFESWYNEVAACHPALRYLKTQTEVAERQIKVASTANLPRLSVGYTGEFVTGQSYQGVTVGVTIPLWENKNKVHQARAASQAAKSALDDATLQYYGRLKSLYNNIVQTQAAVNDYQEALNRHGNDGLLLRALEQGEITLLTYLLEMEYYYASYDRLAQARLDLHLALAELTSAML